MSRRLLIQGLLGTGLLVLAALRFCTLQDSAGEPGISAPLSAETTRIAAVLCDSPCGTLWWFPCH
jgi:hypothetical protein